MIFLPFLPDAHPAFPIASLPEIPNHWRDSSNWHDACPSFLVATADDGDDAIVVFIEYPEIADCDPPEQDNGRYSVHRLGVEGEAGIAYHGDDWDVAVATANGLAAFINLAEYRDVSWPFCDNFGNPMTADEMMVSDGIDAEADRSRA